MATTGYSSPGSITLSSMRQLQALHTSGCRSASSTLLAHPCKMGSLIFFVFLPPIRRLKLITCNKRRFPLSPPLCGHGELEIVSVKELADGFLHFSFGVPSNVSASSKAEDLSSSCGEHLAGKLAVLPRLPSKFSKKSPIPVAAVRRRKQQGENPPKQGLADSTSASVKKPVASSLRPKSYFIKRSPIPVRRDVHPLQSKIESKEANVQHKSQQTPQGTQIGSLKSGISKRPSSAFVRKSPVSRTAPRAKSLLPSANPDTMPIKTGDMAVRSHRNSVVGEASRPKSVFSRRSPIVRAHKLQLEVNTNNTLQQSSKNSSIVGNASGICETMSLESSSKQNVDLHNCKLAELKSLAKTKGLKGYSKLKKGELLDLLQNLES